MPAYDNVNVRRVFQHARITERTAMEKLYDAYQKSDEKSQMSLSVWVNSCIILDEFVITLMNDPDTKRVLIDAHVKKDEDRRNKISKFLNEHIALYQDMLCYGIDETSFSRFLLGFETWLKDTK